MEATTDKETQDALLPQGKRVFQKKKPKLTYELTIEDENENIQTYVFNLRSFSSNPDIAIEMERNRKTLDPLQKEFKIKENMDEANLLQAMIEKLVDHPQEKAKEVFLSFKQIFINQVKIIAKSVLLGTDDVTDDIDKILIVLDHEELMEISQGVIEKSTSRAKKKFI